ncbi:hypothetical protein VPH49_10900 [Pseudomonas luteola]|uniref:hypothetical protein n=1 Tax=Pseudomonas luteola TaxID=47886 RepID=UPI003A8C243B
MFNTKFFKAFGSLISSLQTKTTALADTTAKLTQTTQTLAAGQVTTYTGKTGSNGLLVVDYTALGLKAVPRISFVPRLAKATDSPVFVNMVGAPTLTGVTIQARTQTSVIGLLPQYAAAANIEFDVFVRPVAA